MSYYCIYEVDWLGWDLVEPLTYTLGQGMFVGGVLYCLRNIGKSTQFSSFAEDFNNRRLTKWYRKHGIEPDRLSFLEEELSKITTELNEAEKQRYA